MKKLAFIIAGIIFFCAASVLATSFYRPGADDLVIETLSGERHIFYVEVANTPQKMEKGLMFRKELPENRGMLFALGRSPKFVQFWMKNTLIPLDMIFVGPKGYVVGVHENAQPESLEPVASPAPVIAVIEINGGMAKKLSISEGSRVSHPYFK